MRALGSSLGAWRHIEEREGTRSQHGLSFALAILAEIGRPHGLDLVAEEDVPGRRANGFDAVFVSVLDSRCMLNSAACFRAWGVPLRSADRSPSHPLVWAGGQGLHNPCPYSPIADLIVIGDAEDPLPALLERWESCPDRGRFLAAAANVPGVYVPSVHGRDSVIVQSVASDIAVSLRSVVEIGHDGSRRVEIARGCRSKCAFCSLGWRAPYRENGAAETIAALASGGHRRIHLQAGDAEAHGGIDAIRAHLRAAGGRDLGWTGRLDSLADGDGIGEIEGGKRYAFGVEGVSYRLRRAVGKPGLTDDALIDGTASVLDAISGVSKGRTAWHLIAGLPTERPAEILDLVRVVQEIDRRRRGRTPRSLAIHWQPFQPIPGTPGQWCGSGGGARRSAAYLRGLESQAWVPVHQNVGRTDDVARVCASLARADTRGSDLIEEAGRRRVTPGEAEAITGMTSGPLDPDAPLPWDFIRHHYDRDALRRAHAAMMRRLGEVRG